jgi:endonuclease YncB( thermonuclease family)
MAQADTQTDMAAPSKEGVFISFGLKSDNNKRKSMKWTIFGLFALYAALAYGAETIQGKVVAITDGDTATILINNTQFKIRLAEIDTPEKGQPYGARSKEALSALIFGKEVIAKVQDRDRYGRYVARLYVGNIDVSREMVGQGAAWVYRQYLTDKSLLQVEQEAKGAKRGLWGLPEAENVPPWEWRNGKNQTTTVPKNGINNPSKQTSCGNKQYCGHMTSCEEAKFYLNSCGLSRLDGDSDGVPCESLCR